MSILYYKIRAKSPSVIPSFSGWESLTPYPFANAYMWSAVIGDNIYVGGGYNGGYPYKTYEYNTITDTWTEMLDTPNQQFQSKAVVYNGEIYIWGGGANSAVSIFTPPDIVNTQGQWRTVDPTIKPTSSYRMNFWEIIGTKIYALGGGDSYGTRDIWYFDVLTESWTDTGIDNFESRFDAYSTLYDNKIYMFLGGDGSNGSKTSTYLDLSTDPIEFTGTPLTNPPSYGSFIEGRSVTVGDTIYIAGGYMQPSSPPSNFFYAYTPNNDTWTTPYTNIGTNSTGLPHSYASFCMVNVGEYIYLIGGNNGNTPPYYNQVYRLKVV